MFINIFFLQKRFKKHNFAMQNAKQIVLNANQLFNN